MAQGTSIEWTDATWNPTRGCSRVSEGCRNCYAERVAARFAAGAENGNRGPQFKGFARMTKSGPRWTGRVELIPEKLDEPLSWRRPRRIFVNSMSDLFHEALPDEAISAVIGVIARAPQHTFQVLTKRPQRMREFMGISTRHEALADAGLANPEVYRRPLGKEEAIRIAREPWPPKNLWLGVSVEDQATTDERIPLLLQTPAAKRFVSYEPGLGPVLFRRAVDVTRNGVKEGELVVDHLTGLDWIIVGGESGPGARPFDLAWARSTVAQCRAAGVAVFVKQLGTKPIRGTPPADISTWARWSDSKGGDPAEWPEDLRVREFPA